MSSFAPKSHLTAPVWNWAPFYKETVREVRNGNWTSGDYWGGLEEGVVGLAPFGPMVPEEVQQQVLNKKQEIIDGTEHVFTGPIKDQEGTVRIAEGESMSDEQLLGMDWFVEGVVGSTE
jgi:basic membrane protein A